MSGLCVSQNCLLNVTWKLNLKVLRGEPPTIVGGLLRLLVRSNSSSSRILALFSGSAPTARFGIAVALAIACVEARTPNCTEYSDSARM